MYIILAILLFGILIAAHEWGHFIAARLCGVTVHEFAIGMGPVIWKKKGKKGTQFSLRALPIGGFCALEGEEEESDDPHSVNNQGFWKKVFVFAAGAIMNFLVGVLILLILNSRAAGFTVPVISGTAPEFAAVNGQTLEAGDVIHSINGSRVYMTSDVELLLLHRPGGPAGRPAGGAEAAAGSGVYGQRRWDLRGLRPVPYRGGAEGHSGTEAEIYMVQRR